jgi:aspartyl-tRNA(Asn)/glutamyl-tRNA(Gln) amidotransferase subunit B
MLAGVPVTRIHLEEDTASSIHDDATGSTLVDYNRGGVPLMELVTEPAMHTPEEAGNFARELQLLLRYLGASEANMEKGQMRVEANVSVARKGEMSKTYVEIKNLNSFRTMERAVAYEIERQIKLIQEGGLLQKQTLGWDENKACTFPQRSKEGSADYRYFPDPDLPSLRISEIEGLDADTLSKSLPELPATRRARYMQWGLKPDDAELYVRDTRFGNFIDQVYGVVGAGRVLVTSSNYLANDIANIIREIEERDKQNKQNIQIKVEYFVGMMEKVEEKKLSSRAAKDLLKEVWVSGEDPIKLAEERGVLGGVDTGALKQVVDGVLAANPSVVLDYKNGKTAAIEFLFGQCMKQLRGAGDPAQIRDSLKEALSAA